jgi:uncharacterized protein
MAEDHIRYDILMRDALTGVVRKVLAEVAKTGLPGNHYFYISFATHARGVRIAKRLLERYPEEMTIVLQNQFWDLVANDTGFEVGLSFDDQPETLIIPFSAILGFYDPSVEFGLKFEVEDHAGPAAIRDPDAPEPVEGEAPIALAAEAETADADKVVSLDQFRKKT